MNTQPLLNLQPFRKGEPFERRLKTGLRRIAYDTATRIGYLDCGPNDMPGSIAIFTAIDQEVMAIISPDMAYRRQADGEWDAHHLPAERWEEQRIILNGIAP